MSDINPSYDSSISTTKLQTLLDEAARLYANAGGVNLKKYPLESYFSLLAAYPRERSYDHVSVEVATSALLIEHRYGARALHAYHAVLLIQLIAKNYPKLLDADYPPNVKELGIENFERILGLLIAGTPNADTPDQLIPPTYLHHKSDQFHKDLSAANLSMLVCGGRKLCRVKFPLGLLKSHPTKMLRFMAQNGGSGIFLETHFDSNDKNLRARFGAGSWKKTLMTAAQLMENDREISGFVGHSWYYDPCLEQIAPNLQHIGGMIMENGGSLFCTGTSESTTESALRNSTVRQGLYEMGLYQPKRFKILWPRKAALRWLASQE